MQIKLKKQSHSKPGFMSIFFGAFLFIFSQACFAAPIVITGNHVITTPTSYNHVVLDLSNGRFTVNTGGSLDIENSTINGTISPANPNFVALTNGSLVLKNNTVNVTVTGITPNANNMSTYQIIQAQQGNVTINSTNFTVDTPFTVGFLSTGSLLTSGFNISNNTLINFHGGIYLNNSNNAIVDDNVFTNVSFANIYNSGTLNEIKRNIFSFSGNLMFGDAIDVVNSVGISISDNIISSGSGYGIFIMGGQNLFIENNKITDGSTYAIYIQSPSMSVVRKSKYLNQLLSNYKVTSISNSNIVISNNYIAQNRYGIAGGVVDKLIVTDNTFIQRFTDSSIRQYWTNNDILLPLASNVTWLNNIYKEAFTQEVPGDNSSSLQFVPFPEHGGVYIP